MALSAHAQETVTYKFGWDGRNILYTGNDGSWSFDFVPAGNASVGLAGSEKFLKIGTAAGPYRSATLTHTPISQVTNVNVHFDTNTNHSKTLTVSVGGVIVDTRQIARQDGERDMSFDVADPLDGEVKIIFTVVDEDLNDKSPAIYLHDVTITSSDGEATTVSVPTFEPAGGTYTEPFDLRLTADAGCVIHYTKDGTEATTASPVYSAPIHIDYGTTTVSALAVAANGLTSQSRAETYVVAETVELVPATMEDVRRGGSFYMASSPDLTEAKFARRFSSDRIVATGDVKEAVPVEIRYDGAAYSILLDGRTIGVSDNAPTALSLTQNTSWNITELADGQFIIANTNVDPQTRALLYVPDVSAIRYFNRVTVEAGYVSDYLFLFKAAGAAAPGIAVSDSRFTTFYSDAAVKVPEGLRAAVITGTETIPAAGADPSFRLIYDWKYPAGSVIPAHTAVIMTGDAGSYEMVETTETGVELEKNYLYGTSVTQMITEPQGEYYYFKLAYKSAEDKVLGFWFGAQGGAPFETQGGKAYLAIPKEEFPLRSNGFKLGDGLTGIDDVRMQQAEAVDVYGVDGRLWRRAADRADALRGLPAGVYVVNGERVMVK